MQDSKRSILAWACYDWANSAFATTVMAGFFPVFSVPIGRWGPAVNRVPSIGVANSLGSSLSPCWHFSGSHSRLGKLQETIACLLRPSRVGDDREPLCPADGQLAHGGPLLLVAVVGFSGANTFYDALLPFVASEKKVDYVSSLGYSLGYIGGGTALFGNA
jgi:UMF1 family MFS transporter